MTKMIPILPSKSFWVACLGMLFLFTHHSSWCAPGDNKHASITLSEIQEAIEKRFLSKEVKILRNKLPEDPIVEFGDPHPLSEHYFLWWPTHGVEMSFNKDDRCDAVFLYSGSTGANSKYAGELPLGLSFSDSQADVERKLKNPIKEEPSTLDGITKADWNYPSLGLRIAFVSTKNNKTVIDFIGFSKPEK